MTEPGTLGPFDVSRETLERLKTYAALLRKWNRTINLVSASTLRDIWRRHLLDSAQLWPLVPESAECAIDFGSGAGFPGLIISALSTERPRPLHVHLVESDVRKAAFLRTVARELGLRATVHTRRLETVDLPQADLVTARAFAPLADLLAHTARLRKPHGKALFLKGRNVHKELDEAVRLWDFEYRLYPSLTAQEAAVVEIGAIHGPI